MLDDSISVIILAAGIPTLLALAINHLLPKGVRCKAISRFEEMVPTIKPSSRNHQTR